MEQTRMGAAINEERDEVGESGRRVPATERVLDHILAEMDEGRLGPGARVNAARIAAELGLSAAPVREALSVLAGRGVVDLLPDRGAVVRALTPREVCQFWEVLTPIAALGLRLGARAITAGAEASEILAAYQAIGNHPLEVAPARFLLRLNEWHFAVHRVGGNEFVTLALERLGVAYWDRYLAALIDVRGHIGSYLENYRRMHEAVMAGDGEAAAGVISFHADWSVRRVREAEAALPRPRAPRRGRTR